jgi:hypothetical protein
MNTLDLKTQFEIMLAFIKATWVFPCEEAFEKAAKIAFNQGLVDGRIWIDPFLNFRIGEQINKDKEHLSPIYQRQSNPDIDTAYDALCLFDGNLYTAIYALLKSEKAFKCANYQTMLAKVYQQLATYPLNGVTPKQISKDEEQALIDSYTGFRVESSHRSVPMPERVSPSFMMSIPAFSHKQLISFIYAYGAECAKEKNEQELMAILAPMYLEFRDAPFSVDNHQEFMAQIRQHELFQLMELAQPFAFYTPENYAEAMSELQKHRETNAGLTQDEIAQKHSKMLDEIFDELESEEFEQSQPEYIPPVDALIKHHLEKLSVYCI